MKKRGLLIILSILLLIIVIGCGNKSDVPVQQEQIPVEPLTSAEAQTFMHSLPNIRDATTSTFGSLNIHFADFLTNFDASTAFTNPSAAKIAQMNQKASQAKETLNNIELIVNDFNRKRAGVTLRGSDAQLSAEIESRLSVYSNNKDKINSCVTSMETYAKFIDLTKQRDEFITIFTNNMEKAGNEIDKEQFDNAMVYGKKAKENLQSIKQIDLERSKMGVIEISADVLHSWDLHLEAMDVLLALWTDLKNDNIEAATDKATLHFSKFATANKYGEKEPPVNDQAVSANVWLNSKVGSCKDLI